MGTLRRPSNCSTCGAIVFGLSCYFCSSLGPPRDNTDAWFQTPAGHVDDDAAARQVIERSIETAPFEAGSTSSVPSTSFARFHVRGSST